MATVGLVGGLGPESTVDYYRRILELWQADDPNSAPSVMIDSLDVTRGIHLVRHDLPGLAEYLLSSLERLARAGCDFAALAANTPHIVFETLRARSPIPLLSIVEVCAEEARSRGLTRVGLLGTGFTMQAAFYPEVFRRMGIEVIAPEEHDRAWLHERYLGELLKGVFQDETRAGVRSMIRRLSEAGGIDAVVLAGTELPLLLNSSTVDGLPVLDTTEFHVKAIVRRLQPAALGLSAEPAL